MGKARIPIAYLLRLWPPDNATSRSGANTGAWRAMLEDAQTGQRICFANLLELFAFLEDETTRGHDTPASSCAKGHSA